MREQNGGWAYGPLMKALVRGKSYGCDEVGVMGDIPAVHSNHKGPQLGMSFPSPSSRSSTHLCVCTAFYPQGRNRDLRDYHFKVIKTSILVLPTNLGYSLNSVLNVVLFSWLAQDVVTNILPYMGIRL